MPVVNARTCLHTWISGPMCGICQTSWVWRGKPSVHSVKHGCGMLASAASQTYKCPLRDAEAENRSHRPAACEESCHRGPLRAAHPLVSHKPFRDLPSPPSQVPVKRWQEKEVLALHSFNQIARALQREKNKATKCSRVWKNLKVQGMTEHVEKAIYSLTNGFLNV